MFIVHPMTSALPWRWEGEEEEEEEEEGADRLPFPVTQIQATGAIISGFAPGLA